MTFFALGFLTHGYINVANQIIWVLGVGFFKCVSAIDHLKPSDAPYLTPTAIPSDDLRDRLLTDTAGSALEKHGTFHFDIKMFAALTMHVCACVCVCVRVRV